MWDHLWTRVLPEKINRIIGGMKNTTGMIYGISLYSGNTESHEKYLLRVLQKLQDAGVTIYMDNCEFMQPNIICHETGVEGIHDNPRKVHAIKE